MLKIDFEFKNGELIEMPQYFRYFSDLVEEFLKNFLVDQSK